MKIQTQLIRISGVAIVRRCRRPAWSRPQRSEALFCVRRYLRVNCRVGPAQAGAYARWFCGVTLVDARQECLRQRQLRFAERAGELAGRLGDQRHQFHADRSAAHGNGVPQVYGFTGTATAARSGQT